MALKASLGRVVVVWFHLLSLAEVNFNFIVAHSEGRFKKEDATQKDIEKNVEVRVLFLFLLFPPTFVIPLCCDRLALQSW